MAEGQGIPAGLTLYRRSEVRVHSYRGHRTPAYNHHRPHIFTISLTQSLTKQVPQRRLRLRDLRDAGKLRLTWLHFMSWGSVSQTLGTAAFVLELRHIFHTLLIFFIINNWILSVLVKTFQREIEEWSWWKQKAEVYYSCFRFFSPFSLIHLSKYKHKAS